MSSSYVGTPSSSIFTMTGASPVSDSMWMPSMLKYVPIAASTCSESSAGTRSNPTFTLSTSSSDEPLVLTDRVEDRVVERESRHADRRAFHGVGTLHLRVRERHERVQRLGDQRAHGDHGKAFLRREEHVALIEDREVELIPRDELQAGGDVRGGLELHRQVLIVEVPVVEGVVERHVIGVREPIQGHLEGRRLTGATAAARAAGRRG